MDYIEEMNFMQERAAIHPELDAALGAYMAGLDDPEVKAAALERFDAALVRLREVYRKFEYQWISGQSNPPSLFRR
ncbi:MAG: hypothetical protein ACLQF1_16840 [Methyloceanibacter sp.]